MEKILIFGGAGFIGSNLVDFLSERGDSIHVFDNFSMGMATAELPLKAHVTRGDMRNLKEVIECITAFQPTRIYHLAANSDIAASSVNPSADVQNTLLSSVVLARALANNSCDADLIFASSSAIYGLSPHSINEDFPPKPESSYGWMKLASEAVLSNLVSEGFIKKLLIARFPNVTGRHQTHGVVHDLVKKLKVSPQRLQVLGDGSQLKPYVLASELVASLENVISSSWSGSRTYNFAPKDRISVRTIAEIVAKVSKLSPTIEFGNTSGGWPGDIPKYLLDCSKIESDFGPLKYGSSETAILAAAEWAWQEM